MSSYRQKYLMTFVFFPRTVLQYTDWSNYGIYEIRSISDSMGYLRLATDRGIVPVLDKLWREQLETAMFRYRELFLAVTISSASIVLADVLVQPGYEHQYGNKSPQPVPQHSMQPSTKQYHVQQLPNQQSTRYLSGVQTVYPYHESYQDKARSNILSYSPYHRPPYHHHHYHYLPRPTQNLHYAKIGGHGYVRPSVFLGYPQPLVVHYRYRRSHRSDPTSTESSKSAIVAHDDDVAAKSPLTDAEQPTAIDSLLPEHEPTDTNDKRVKSRQSKNDYGTTGPLLLGLYPKNMYSQHREVESTNEMQHPKSLPANPSTPRHLDEQSPAIAKLTVSEPKQQTPVSQQNGIKCFPQDYEASRINHEVSHLASNKPSVKWEQFSSPILIPTSSQIISPDKKSALQIVYHDYGSGYQDPSTWNTFQTFNPQMQYGYGSTYGYSPKYYSMYNSLTPLSNLHKNVQDNQQAAYQEPEKQSLQERKTTDMINTAEPRQNKIVIRIPNSPKTSDYPKLETSNTPVTHTHTITSVHPQEPSVTDNRYRTNEKLSGTNNMVVSPYFARNDISFPKHPFYYPSGYLDNDLDYDSNDYSDEYSNDEDFYLNQRNCNSAHHTPPIRVPDYILYTNISAQSNLASTIPQMQKQLLYTYNYPSESKIQATPQDSKYYYSTNEGTPLYGTFPSSAYY